MNRLPGKKWRLQAHHEQAGPINVENAGTFDELVVDDWFHIEQMNTRSWWMRLGETDYNITIPPTGKVVVTVQEGPCPCKKRGAR